MEDNLCPFSEKLRFRYLQLHDPNIFLQKIFFVQYTILLVFIFMFDSITGLLAYVYQDQVDIDLNQHLVESFIQVIE